MSKKRLEEFRLFLRLRSTWNFRVWIVGKNRSMHESCAAFLASFKNAPKTLWNLITEQSVLKSTQKRRKWQRKRGHMNSYFLKPRGNFSVGKQPSFDVAMNEDRRSVRRICLKSFRGELISDCGEFSAGLKLKGFSQNKWRQKLVHLLLNILNLLLF